MNEATTGAPAQREAVERAARMLGEELGDRVRRGFPLSPLTSFRIGGPAAMFVQAESEDDLAAVSRATTETAAPLVVIGKGSNLLISDDGFDGIVIRLGRGFRWASWSDDRLSAGAAMPLPALAGVAQSEGLAGLEFGIAIPGSVGGAVAMNAGAHGREMAEVVESIGVFDLPAGRSMQISAGEIRFGYRVTSLPRGGVVTGATLALTGGDPERIRAEMDHARAWRRRTQPLAEPSCGSVFKNPPGRHAAGLIQESGGKDLRVGGASVSSKHANFIVTTPGTRASDVVELIRSVQELVADRSGVRLETEVCLVGSFDRRPH